MSSHKTCHLSKTGLWVSFSQWLSFLITNSLWDFYTYREWFLPTTTPLKTVTTMQQNEYTHLRLNFQTGNISQNSHTPTSACAENEGALLGSNSFSKLERSVLNSHTCMHLRKNWRDPPAQQSLQIWHFLQGVCGFRGHFLHLHQRFNGIQSVVDRRRLTQRCAHPLLQKTFACDTMIFIRQWYSNVLRNWSWWRSIHTVH